MAKRYPNLEEQALDRLGRGESTVVADMLYYPHELYPLRVTPDGKEIGLAAHFNSALQEYEQLWVYTEIVYTELGMPMVGKYRRIIWSQVDFTLDNCKFIEMLKSKK